MTVDLEQNLGRVLHNLKASDVVVGTKVRLPSAEFGCIADAVATSLEGSLAPFGQIRASRRLLAMPSSRDIF